MLEISKHGEQQPSQHSILQKRALGSMSNLYPDRAAMKNAERKAVHKIKLWLFRLLAVCAVLMVCTYVLNLVLPDCLCWLNIERMQLLKDQSLSILTGLGVGLVLSLMHDK